MNPDEFRASQKYDLADLQLPEYLLAKPAQSGTQSE
jgi:hypothetical protein